MATDPERPIEKLLHACAQKRRDEAGAPLELHPATRRVLQDEVARRFDKAGRGRSVAGGGPWWRWPRLAWALGGFALVVVGGLLFLPARSRPQTEALLAKADRSQALEKAPALPPPPATVSAVDFAKATPAPAKILEADRLGSPAKQKTPLLVVQRQTNLSKDRARAATELAEQPKFTASATAPSGAASQPLDVPSTPMPTSALVPENQPPANRYGLASGPSQIRPPTDSFQPLPTLRSPADNTNQPAELLYALKGDKSGAVQQFVRADSAVSNLAGVADKLSPANSVLVSFQVEQAGPQMRIVDQDGSVYAGYVSLARGVAPLVSGATATPAQTRALRASSGRFEAGGAPQSAVAQQNGVYYFRVAGTNLSLNQSVVFTGNLQAPGQSGAGRFSNQLQALPALPSSLSFPNSAISGKALVGGQEIDVNAIPAKP